MLEVIESDFARLESDTKAAEATAQKEYDEFMTDSKVDKSEKSTDIEHKTAKKQDESQALTTKKEDLEGTQKGRDRELTGGFENSERRGHCMSHHSAFLKPSQQRKIRLLKMHAEICMRMHFSYPLV